MIIGDIDMKILIVTPSRHGFGGVEAFNRRLEKLLVSLGCEVDIFAGDEITYDEKNIFKQRLVRKFGRAILVKDVLKEKINIYDIVICSGEYGYGLKGQNIISYFHGSYYGYLKYCKEHIRYRERIHFRILSMFQKRSAKGKRIVCVSEFIKNMLSKQGIEAGYVIDNYIDIDLFKPIYEDRTDHYLFVGRYDLYGKGIDIIKALQKRYDIDVYTDGKYEGVDNCIESHFSDGEMVSIYNHHRILIFPSRFEACGLVTIEAMACGLPVVIFNVGIGDSLKKEIPEFVVDIEKDGVNEFCHRIELIEQEYQKYSNAARKYVCQHHSKYAFLEKIKTLIGLEVYQEKINKR